MFPRIWRNATSGFPDLGISDKMRVTEISVTLVSLSLRAHNLALLYQLAIPANPGYLYTDKSGLAVIPDLIGDLKHNQGYGGDRA